MNRFNLTFKGEIQPGKDPGQVKARFGKLFGIDDPQRLERFFSGDTIVLRRNLDRKVAAEYFSKMRKLGVEAELVKVTTEEATTALAPARASSPEPKPEPKPSTAADDTEKTPHRRGMDRDILQRSPGQVDQSWAVSTSRGKATTNTPATTQVTTKRKKSPRQTEDSDQRSQQQRKEAEAQREAALEQAEQQKREAARLQAEQDARVAEVTARRKQQQAKATEEAKRKAEEEVKRKAAEEEARRKAEEEAKRKAAEEEARRKAEEEAKRKAAEEEARRKAEEEAKRRAAEAEARRKAEEEAKRRAAEAEARRKAEEEAKRKAAEEEARRKAEEEAKRKAAEEEARRKAAEEAKRKAEEEAKRKAELAAQRKAAKEEARRKAAEAAARRKAEREEQRRLKEQQAAKEKAAKEAARRKAAEDAARRKAEEDAKRKAQQEQARLEAELERQRLQREREELERERVKAEQERKKLELERKRIELERKTAERERKAAERARIKAEQEKVRQQNAAEAARRAAKKAEQQRKKSEEERLAKAASEKAKAEIAAREAREQAKREAQLQEQQEQRKALEDRAITRAARELTRQPGLKPVTGQVKTRLETPRTRRPRQKASSHQAGAPNLYTLRPFRNTPAVKARCQDAEHKMQRQLTIAAVALSALLVLGGLYLNRAPAPLVNSAHAVAIDPKSGPVLLAGDRLLLHDRAGLGTEEITLEKLGISHITGGLAFDSRGNLLALGSLSTAPDTVHTGSALLRCQLQATNCEQLFPANEADDFEADGFDTLAVHPLDDSLFGANLETGQLKQLLADSTELHSAEIPLPAAARLHLQSGLLFINSVSGPAISVYRYDSNAFGKQLDEILLLPPPAAEKGESQVHDFLWSADSWWVILRNPETDTASVYRFDAQWDYLGEAGLAAGTHPEALVNWGRKTLVLDRGKIALQRFNDAGMAEAPLTSKLLQQLSQNQQRHQWLSALGWHIGLFSLTLLCLVTALLAWLQSNRALVYRDRSASGAPPIDDIADQIQWLDPVAGREAHFRRLISLYSIFSLAVLTIAVGTGVHTVHLIALLLVLLGPGIGLIQIQRSHCGNLGIARNKLVLVDHDDMYHLGNDARLQYRGPFLLIDDVVLFTGTRLLPVFSPVQLRDGVQALAEGGIRVDRKTILVKLLQCQHPFIRAAEITGACLCLALLASVVQLS